MWELDPEFEGPGGPRLGRMFERARAQQEQLVAALERKLKRNWAVAAAGDYDPPSAMSILNVAGGKCKCKHLPWI